MSSTLFHVKQVDIELFTCGLSLIIDALPKRSETMIKKCENRKRGLPKLQAAAPARQELGLPNAPAAAMHLEASAPHIPLTQARHSGTTIWALPFVTLYLRIKKYNGQRRVHDDSRTALIRTIREPAI